MKHNLFDILEFFFIWRILLNIHMLKIMLKLFSQRNECLFINVFHVKS